MEKSGLKGTAFVCVLCKKIFMHPVLFLVTPPTLRK